MAKMDNDRRMMTVEQNSNDALKAEVQKQMLEIKRQERLAQFDQQVINLGMVANKFEEKYGTEDYRTQIMAMFLDLALQMKEVIELISGVQTAMQCIGQAIDCVDDLLNMQEEMLEGSLAQNYGLFERMKRKRKINRAMRNNRNRMKQMCASIEGGQKMALDMVNALRKSCGRMKLSTEKSFAKQKKSDSKGGTNISGDSAITPAARKFMDDLRAQNGGDTDKGVPTSPAVPTTNGSASSSTDDTLGGII